ncbi:SRPBCC family protein [Aquimarina sp. 2201CG14-23]|uniref:SRPBCC family protein n=1 Tax=Aquimarina mycalae TaxID=3040073 RepID=UPI002477FBB5|nr:SRPBCC family protein [Aquimarina sp. 2201CG14-23]MDH7444968.1 SRPBCC family protein [Aquimarina sp. 2201CG14-23]
MKYLKYLLFLIIILALIFFGKGMLTPSVSYENEVVVNKPANESWAVMSDESNLPKWIKGFTKTELVSGTANEVGAVSKVYVEDRGEEMVMEETVTALTLNEHMAMTFTMDFMDMDYEMFFKEDDGKTTITTKSIAMGNGILSKSLISFMPGAMKAQEDENLNSLKRLIEENTKDYFPKKVVDTSAVSVEE